jgi:2-amino-4-hydroxy-6-hydroxymethyldihydropteridine diphosphokinase
MPDVCLGLGSNLGDKAGHLRAALDLLRRDGVQPVAISSLYRTDPVGYLDQDWFLNAAAVVRTHLDPHDLLGRLLGIERALGRVRGVRNGPRSIDLDILLWQDLVLTAPDLTIPHPRLHERLFVLAPLAEIAPTASHPVLGTTLEECRVRCIAEHGLAGVERWAGPEWANPPRAAGREDA